MVNHLSISSPLDLGGPSVKVGLSAKFGVAVFKASILDSVGGPLAKVGSSAKFGVAVFKAYILNYPGGPSATGGLSAKFGVAVFKASIPDLVGTIGQSKFICQVVCTSIQGISVLSECVWGIRWPK